MSKYTEKTETINLPTIALRGVVGFPAVQLNLEITRGFSLKAFSKAAANSGKVLLLTQKHIDEDFPTQKDFFDIGTIAQIRHVVKNTDGNLSVIFEGISRAKVLELVEMDGYKEATVLLKPMRNVRHNSQADVLMNAAKQLLEDMPSLYPGFTEEIRLSACAINDAGMFADFVASSALSDWRNKQIVLESLSPISRLEKLLTFLEEPMDIMRCEFEITRKVRMNIEENQREYYLREQVKVIQQELGEDCDEIEESSISIKTNPFSPHSSKPLPSKHPE